jgi:hypothetical protein
MSNVANIMGLAAGADESIKWISYDLNTFTAETSGTLSTGQSGTGITFSTDGTKFYSVYNGDYTVYQYSCATPFDISTVSYDSKSFTTTSGVTETAPFGIAFKDDGTKMFVNGQGVDGVIEYALSTPWDVSTASYTTYTSMLSSGNNFTGIHFKPDGTKVYLMNSSDVAVQWSLSTAWDISTATYDSKSFLTNSQDSVATDLYLSSDGLKLYTNGITGDNIYQYSLSTAWDISTASYDSISFSYNAQGTNSYNLTFHPDGSKFYVGFGNTVYQYTAV